MKLAIRDTISNLLALLFKSLCGDIEKFFSSVQFFLLTFPKLSSTKWDHLWGKIMQIFNGCDKPLLHHNETLQADERMCINAMMLDRLGMVWGLESVNGKLGEEDILTLFEEEEPSLEEIKEAFGVFDVNNDGFIDAGELQRVVCNLGLECGLEECKRMIKAFDGNGDGLIDFQEFVKLMELCLC